MTDTPPEPKATEPSDEELLSAELEKRYYSAGLPECGLTEFAYNAGRASLESVMAKAVGDCGLEIARLKAEVEALKAERDKLHIERVTDAARRTESCAERAGNVSRTKDPKDNRMRCQFCGMRTWSRDRAGFMRDHDRPDGRVCRRARATVATKGRKP